MPIFVYILPTGELRGGAWVVFDTSINPDCIEMYADQSSSGGILEANATKNVKYKPDQIYKTMHRLDNIISKSDHLLAELDAISREDKSIKSSSSIDLQAISDLENEIRSREKFLFDSYDKVSNALF